ncbi:MAG: hypothetical protein ACREBY_14750, partial [Polaromonas sp.]
MNYACGALQENRFGPLRQAAMQAYNDRIGLNPLDLYLTRLNAPNDHELQPFQAIRCSFQDRQVPLEMIQFALVRAGYVAKSRRYTACSDRTAGQHKFTKEL